MTELFFAAVNLSIQAGWLVLAIVVLRFLLRRVPRWIFLLLWGMVGLRLVFPFSVESAWSLIPSAETISPSVLYMDVPQIRTGLPIVNQTINPMLEETLTSTVGASVNPMQVLAAVLSWLWVAGLAGMLLYLGVSWGKLSRRLRTAVRLQDCVYQSEQVHSPFVFGFLHPRIILPFSLSEGDRPFVIAHEKSHIQRGDPWIKMAAFLLLSVYWFHPLIWLAYFLLCRDMELACDERVIRGLDREGRAGYSQALLSCSAVHRGNPVCPVAFGEFSVRKRVKAVLRYRKPLLWVTALAVVAVALTAVCFLTTPQIRPTMEWAQNLSGDDIVSAELVVMPQATDKQYRVFDENEFAGIAALINGSHGRYVAEPENLAGGSIQFHITTSDGVEHTVSNMGNTYLYIDGDTFSAGYGWLSSWDAPYGEGNAPLPEQAEKVSATGAWKWFDMWQGEEPFTENATLETTLAAAFLWPPPFCVLCRVETGGNS